MVFSLTALSRLVPRLKLDPTIDIPHVEITPNHNNNNELRSGTNVITTTTAAGFETRPPGIYIVRTSSLIHLIRPPGNDPGQDEEPREDAVLTGYVAVRTERPCRARGLRVEFIGEVRLALPGESQGTSTLKESVSKTSMVDTLQVGRSRTTSSITQN
jgi:hypothetical protein